MPMPYTYRHAGAEWRAILDTAREEMGLVSDNSAFTAIEGVLLTFRRRLDVHRGLDFASELPAVPRAIFVARWVPATPLPFTTRAGMTAEARALRRHHNLTPENCIEATARALRPHMDDARLFRLLATFPEGAATFWQVPDPQPAPRFP